MAKIRKYSSRRPPRARKYVGKKRMASMAVAQAKRKAFHMAVKKIVTGMAEKKHTEETGNISLLAYDGSTNQASIDTTNQIFFDPAIGLGSEVDERVANKIRFTKVKFNYALIPNPTGGQNGVAYPTYVRFIFYYDREDPQSASTPYTNNNFFDNGSGFSGFTGGFSDMVRKYNTDRYRIMKVRTFKLGFANNQGTGGNAAAQYFANNDFRMAYRGSIDLTNCIIKRQKFSDNLATSMTRKLYCIVCVSSINQGALATTARPAYLTYNTTYEWTDL